MLCFFHLIVFPGPGSSILGGVGSVRGRACVGYPGCGGADEQRVQALRVRTSACGDCATELPGAGAWFSLFFFVVRIYQLDFMAEGKRWLDPFSLFYSLLVACTAGSRFRWRSKKTKILC